MKKVVAIDYFYQGHLLSSLQQKFSFRARKKMFNFWMKKGLIKGESILDVGTTPDMSRLDSNCLLRWTINNGFHVTAVSIETLDPILDEFHQLKVLPKIANKSKFEIYAPDKSFDWVMSSAVIEHVGCLNQQIEFLRECSRVASGIFLTTPNRWHWLEFHTKIPFIHWLPRPIHRKILSLLGLTFWSKEENLNLLSKKQLIEICKKALSDKFEIQVSTIWSIGMQSNLILLAKIRK